MFPKGNNVDSLSMYLDVADSSTLPYGWIRFAQFSLAVVNQVHSEYSIRKGIFLTIYCCWSFTVNIYASVICNCWKWFFVDKFCDFSVSIMIICCSLLLEDWYWWLTLNWTAHILFSVEVIKVINWKLVYIDGYLFTWLCVSSWIWGLIMYPSAQY